MLLTKNFLEQRTEVLVLERNSSAQQHIQDSVPELQTSISGPEYLRPSITSGAAKLGLPQLEAINSPSTMAFEMPNSAILTLR
jgi:hypothetical protein